MTVSVSATAQSEIDAAAAYYHSISPRLAVRLLKESADVMQFIDDHPRMYRRTSSNVRIASLRSFPFELYYRVRLSGTQVIRFLPARIDPETKQARIASANN